MTKETCPNGETCYSAVLSLPLYKIIFLTRLSSFVRNILIIVKIEKPICYFLKIQYFYGEF